MTTITKSLCERYIWKKLQEHKKALLQIEQGKAVEGMVNNAISLLKNTIKVHEDALKELERINKKEFL